MKVNYLYYIIIIYSYYINIIHYTSWDVLTWSFSMYSYSTLIIMILLGIIKILNIEYYVYVY